MSERTPEPSLKDILAKTVEDIAASAYRRISVARDIPMTEVYRSGVCEDISEIVANKLYAIYGGDVQLMRYERQGIGTHQFIRVVIGSEQWIIDPTWQQFLPEADPRKPRILCVPAADLSQTLSGYGIAAEVRSLWTEAHVVPTPGHDL